MSALFRWPCIVQVAPHGDGGVADYMARLGQAWRSSGLDSLELRLCRDDDRASPLAQRLRTLCPDRRCTLVLHFSGYGYAARGLCGWLVDSVRESRQLIGDRLRVLTVFHELFAGGPPWRSAFWTSGLQARVACGMARQSDAIWTNSEHHGRWLRARAPDVAVEVAPVFSTVGEADLRRGPHDRDPVLLIFGGPSTRRRAVAGLRGQGAQLRALGIEALVEAGAGKPCAIPPGLPTCEHLGPLDLPDLRDRLDRSRFGLIDYPARHLGKSSVFAAYTSFGCVTLNTCTEASTADGLSPGAHYLPLTDATRAWSATEAVWLSRLQTISDKAAGWYAGHRLAVQADGYLRLIASLDPDAPTGRHRGRAHGRRGRHTNSP